MWNSILNVFQKEWRDISRDRYSLFSVATFVFLSPLMMYGLTNWIASEVRSEDVIKIASVGKSHAPGLVGWLEEKNYVLQEFEEIEQAKAELTKELPIVIEIPSDYSERFKNRKPIKVAVTGNFKDTKTEEKTRRLARTIDHYGQQIAQTRLITAGISPQRINAVSAQTHDLSLSGARTIRITNMLIYIFLIAGFVGGAFSADTIAGERERNSLEPLLSQPVNPFWLVVGKWLAVSLVCVLCACLTLQLGMLALGKAPLAEIGIRLFLTTSNVILGTLLLAPLAMFAVSLQMLLAARAKTYREAMTYSQFTVSVPVLIAGAMIFGVEFGPFSELLPVAGQATALRDLFLEGAMSSLNVLGTSVTTLIVAGLLLTWTTKRFAAEGSL